MGSHFIRGPAAECLRRHSRLAAADGVAPSITGEARDPMPLRLTALAWDLVALPPTAHRGPRPFANPQAWASGNPDGQGAAAGCEPSKIPSQSSFAVSFIMTARVTMEPMVTVSPVMPSRKWL